MPCQAITDKLNKMKVELEQLALNYEPALNEPDELRSIAGLIEQFNRRPDTPMTFDRGHIEHLVDMIDNADDLIEIYSAVDQTISDMHVAGHYGLWSDWTSDCQIEINDMLYHLVVEAFEMAGHSSPDPLEEYRTNMMNKVEAWLSRNK